MGYDESKNNYEIVLERYVGKSPKLIKIENEIDKVIKMVKKGHYSFINKTRGKLSAKELNESKENKNIERMFKEFFKLKDFSLTWIYTPEPNAMTPCKTFQVLDKHYKVDKTTGHDYNDNLKIYVLAHTGMITHANLNAAEIMSIILHEIGHNFYKSIFQVLHDILPVRWSPFSTIELDARSIPHLLAIGLRNILDVGKGITVVKKAFDDIIDGLGLRPLIVYVQEFSLVKQRLTPNTIRQIALMLANPLSLLPLNPITSISRYNMEKHADSFAVDYGYGPSSVTAQNKMDRREKDKIYDVPVINWVYDFDALLFDLTINNLTGYPTGLNRQYSALKRLKNAQKDSDLPVELRKELEGQIKEIEKTLKSIESFSNDENKKRIFTWLYRNLVVTLFDGIIDVRELIYRYTKEYDTNDTWSKLH